MGRKYVRDRRGRFASVGATARGGRLTNLSGKRYERQTMTAGARTGVLRPGAVRPAAPAAAVPRSGRVPFSRPRPGNSIRPAKLPGRGMRKIDRAADTLNQAGQHLGRARKIADRLDRIGTRDALSSKAMDREIARQAGQVSTARTVVQRRMQRAFNVQNGRNPQIGSRALFVYQAQLRQLGAPANQRSAFRRKPMTPKEAARAKAKRDAADRKRLDAALKQEMRDMLKSSKPKPPRKPRKKKS